MTGRGLPPRRFRLMQEGRVLGHAVSLDEAKRRLTKPLSTITNIDTGRRWILEDGAWRETLPEPRPGAAPRSVPSRAAPEPPPRRWRADIDG